MAAIVPALVWLAKLVAMMFFSYVINQIFGPDADDYDPDLEQGGHLKAKRSTSAALSLIYGTCRVGVNQVFVGTSGTDNEYLHIVGAVGEGPVNQIHQVDSVDQFFLDDKIYTDYGSNVHYEFFTGTSTQNVCSTLNTAIPEWTDPLRYTAYIYVRLKWDIDKFNSIPNITAILEGLEVWDPTDDVTENTDNPALCTYDMLTRPSVRGGFGLDTWYGPEPATPRINTGSVDDTKDYCITKGWTSNFPITEAKKAVMDNINMILPNFRGALVYSENKFKVLFMDLNYEAVVMSFDDDDVISDNIESSLKINRPNIFNRPNAVRAKYLSSRGAPDGSGTYQIADLVKTDSDAVTADGDYRETEVKLYGLNTVELVGKMLNYHLERMRWGNIVSFTAGGKAQALEPMDLIQLTHTMPGWTDQQLRVTNISYMENNIVNITGIQEVINLYDDVYDVTSHNWYQTNLPNILSPVASVINVSNAESVYYYRERSFTRWKIDFDPPAAATYPWWDYAEIWISIGGTSDYRYMTKSTSDYLLDPVEEGELYYVKIRSVSVSGAKEDFDSCYTVSKTILGRTDVPSDLVAMTAVANGNNVTIYADPISDPDIAGYEIRRGDSWAAALFVSMEKNCSLTFTGVRPGTHKFWMSPKGNNGLYSTNPVSATVDVFLPPSYTLLTTYGTWTWDFGTGYFINTEQYTDSSAVDWLRLIPFENRLSDGGFENGDFTAWDSQQSSVIESTIKKTGDYSSKLVATGAANVLGCYVDYEINPFAFYGFTQWVYMATHTTGNFLNCYMAFYTDALVYISNTNAGNHDGTLSTWQEFERVIGPYVDGDQRHFTIPVNAKYVRIYGGGYWYNASGNPSGTAYTDDNNFEVLTAQAIENGTCEYAEPAMWGTALIAYPGTKTRSSAQADTGSYSMLFTGDGLTSAHHALYFSLADARCPYGANYEFEVRIYIPSGNTELTDLRIWIQIKNKDGDTSNVMTSVVTTQGSWQNLSYTSDIAEDERIHTFIVVDFTTQISSETFYVDNWRAKQINPRTGKWVSPTHDLNAIEIVRIWGNFDTAFVSSETTFGGVMGTTDTFGDHDADTKTFSQIFSSTSASRLNATLLHREGSGDFEVKEFFEVLSADVKARYIGAEATVINPSNDARLSLEELDMLAYEGPAEV